MRTENEPIEQRDDLLPVAGERKQRMEGDSSGDTECPKIQKLVIGDWNPLADSEKELKIQDYLSNHFDYMDLPTIPSNPVVLMDCLYSELCFSFWHMFRYAYSSSNVTGEKLLVTDKDKRTSPGDILNEIGKSLTHLKQILTGPCLISG